ncbi:hypothetical protein LXL04_016380 [Taraxacum kok-saghyz]
MPTPTILLCVNTVNRGYFNRAGRPNVAVNGGVGDNRLASKSGRPSVIAIAKSENLWADLARLELGQR